MFIWTVCAILHELTEIINRVHEAPFGNTNLNI
jgi:hypothetical protein